MTGNTEVVDNIVVADGYSHEDLKQLTSERLAAYLGVATYKPNEEDLHMLFEQAVAKVTDDLARQEQALESFANALPGQPDNQPEVLATGGIEHIITDQDMLNNPELAQHDVQVGDAVELPPVEEVQVPVEPAAQFESPMLDSNEPPFQASQPPVEPSNTQAYVPDPTPTVD